jgi:hypothetical protein
MYGLFDTFQDHIIATLNMVIEAVETRNAKREDRKRIERINQSCVNTHSG